MLAVLSLGGCWSGSLLFWFIMGVVLLLGVVLLVKLGLGLGFSYCVSGLLGDKVVVVVLVLLCFMWLSCMGNLSSDSQMKWKGESLVLSLLCLMLILVFVVDSWVLFYVFYEGSMLPLIVGVLLFGGYYERLGSVVYLVVYMVLFSSPFVIILLVYLSLSESVSMGAWGVFVACGVLGLVVILSVLVKVPIYGLHSWLPKVHVEAPTWGSVILAAIMIKMGVYGLLRMREEIWGYSLSLVWMWSLLGVVVSAFICLMVSDFKKVVAYSSVVHMGGVIWLSGFSLVSSWRGVLLVIVMHGLVSGYLFLIAGFMGELGASRSFLILSTMVDYLTFWGCLILLGLVMNVSFPLSGTMLGELEVLFGVCGLWDLGYVFIIMIMFTVCVYNVFIMVVLFGSRSSLLIRFSLSLSFVLVVLMIITVSGLIWAVFINYWAEYKDMSYCG